MPRTGSPVLASRITRSILTIRGRRVMLDADLADLYGVRTNALNQAVKRNRSRFPGDFMFRLSVEEKREVVTNCDHLRRLKYSSSRPYAFTEHGALMLASVLNSSVAVQVSLQVVRAFVRLRELMGESKDLARKLTALERKYDARFRVVFDAIRRLMTAERTRRQIGFRATMASMHPLRPRREG